MRYFSNGVLIAGLIVLFQGAIAFFLRFNFITGTRYGPSLIPVYLIFAGVGILVLWLVLRAIAHSLDASKKKGDR